MTSQRSSGPPAVSQQALGRLPDFLIIGAQRSGTTSLARYLATHPEMYVASQKEVHFFDRHFSKGLDWYRLQFAEGADAGAVGEATPEYMYDPVALARLAETVPDAKLIVSLRNPVDRAYSEYWFVRGRGYESLALDEALAAEPARLTSSDPLERMRHAYVDRGRYLVQLQKVCEFFPRDQVLVVVFEEWMKDPGAALRAMQRFVGVTEDFVPSNVGRRFGRARTFRSQGLRKLARVLPYPFGAAVSRLNARPDPYPPMDHRTRESLQEQFAADNHALAAWLGRDLSVWDSPIATTTAVEPRR